MVTATDPVKMRALREAQHGLKPPRQRVDTGQGNDGNPMFDMSDAFGASIRNSMRGFQTANKENIQTGMNDLAAAGATPEQMLRFRTQANKDVLAGSGNIVSQGNQAQAGAIFQATEARNAQEQAAKEAMDQMLAQQGWQQKMALQERGWNLEDAKKAEKLAREKRWWDLGGIGLNALISTGLPLLAGG